LPTEIYWPVGENAATFTEPNGVPAVGQLENAVKVGRCMRRNWFFLAELARDKISDDVFMDRDDIGVVRFPKLFRNFGLDSRFVNDSCMSYIFTKPEVDPIARYELSLPKLI